MKGDDKVLELLNEVLTAELTAINQYFVHAKMLRNWGFDKLAERVRHESIDEMRHADELIERILFLEGVPNLQRLGTLNVGETVKEQFKSDLALEYAAIKRLNDGVKLCEARSDNKTRQLIESILSGEEEHADWLETQLGLMETLGETQYLAEQMG